MSLNDVFSERGPDRCDWLRAGLQCQWLCAGLMCQWLCAGLMCQYSGGDLLIRSHAIKLCVIEIDSPRQFSVDMHRQVGISGFFCRILGDFGDDIAMPLATMMIEIVSLITGCAVSQHML